MQSLFCFSFIDKKNYITFICLFVYLVVCFFLQAFFLTMFLYTFRTPEEPYQSGRLNNEIVEEDFTRTNRSLSVENDGDNQVKNKNEITFSLFLMRFNNITI
jgi:hypothetical protein